MTSYCSLCLVGPPVPASAFDLLCNLGYVTCPFRVKYLHLNMKRLGALHAQACKLCLTVAREQLQGLPWGCW